MMSLQHRRRGFVVADTIEACSRALMMLLIAAFLMLPAAAQASGGSGLDARPALAAEDAGTTVVVVDGLRHYVFSCPDGFPDTAVTLAELFADCELQYVYFCLNLPLSPVPDPFPRPCGGRHL